MTDYLYFKTGNANFKVFLSEILYAKAEGKYVRISTTARTHFVRCAISCLQESSLMGIQFCRIHKSYIISVAHITRYDNKSVYIGAVKLPIGRHYKNQFHQKLVM